MAPRRRTLTPLPLVSAAQLVMLVACILLLLLQPRSPLRVRGAFNRRAAWLSIPHKLWRLPACLEGCSSAGPRTVPNRAARACFPSRCPAQAPGGGSVRKTTLRCWPGSCGRSASARRRATCTAGTVRASQLRAAAHAGRCWRRMAGAHAAGTSRWRMHLLLLMLPVLFLTLHFSNCERTLLPIAPLLPQARQTSAARRSRRRRPRQRRRPGRRWVEGGCARC